MISIIFTGCKKQQDITDYSEIESWAYCAMENDKKAVDVFFISPTVYGGSENEHNMRLDDVKTKKNFMGAGNMEKGIYDKDSRFFAPYYQQAGFWVYMMPEEDREPYLELAYSDVKAAFEYYMENYNEGRPIVIAGFSQGADLCIRLMKDCFTDEEKNELLVACYAIGWSITEEELEEYPAGVELFEDGIYHLYDYQFFYRNIQKNVKVRIEAFTGTS